jgi:hypothetical protein
MKQFARNASCEWIMKLYAQQIYSELGLVKQEEDMFQQITSELPRLSALYESSVTIHFETRVTQLDLLMTECISYQNFHKHCNGCVYPIPQQKISRATRKQEKLSRTLYKILGEIDLNPKFRKSLQSWILILGVYELTLDSLGNVFQLGRSSKINMLRHGLESEDYSLNDVLQFDHDYDSAKYKRNVDIFCNDVNDLALMVSTTQEGDLLLEHVVFLSALCDRKDLAEIYLSRCIEAFESGTLSRHYLIPFLKQCLEISKQTIHHGNTHFYFIFDAYSHCQEIPTKDLLLPSDLSLRGLIQSDSLISTVAAFGIDSIKTFCQRKD